MKILIIGKTGQLGFELTKALENHALLTPSIEQLDVLDTETMSKYIIDEGPEVIINTSACHDLHKCEENTYLAFSLNWLAVRNLAVLSKSINSLFITISTNYVFDGGKSEPYKEDDYTNPLQVYGLSKLAGEDSVLNHYPENSIIIRTAVLFGGKGSPNKKGGNFILSRLSDINKNELAVDSKQISSVAYAKDLAFVIKKMIKNKNIKPGIYHVVNEGDCSWYELTKYIFEFKGSNCKLNPIDRKGIDGRLRRPIYTPLSTEKIKSMGIALSPWKDAVSRYLAELEGAFHEIKN